MTAAMDKAALIRVAKGLLSQRPVSLSGNSTGIKINGNTLAEAIDRAMAGRIVITLVIILRSMQVFIFPLVEAGMDPLQQNLYCILS